MTAVHELATESKVAAVQVMEGMEEEDKAM